MRKIYLAFALFCIALTSQAQIRMTMVDPANHQIQIKNFGMMAVDISTYQLCALFDYQTLNQAPVTISTGDFNLSPDESVTITWNNSGGVGFLTTASDIGLYLPSGNFGSAANMVDFMQYGAGGQGRENVAVAGGRWTAGQFLVTSTGPWVYTGDGTQNGNTFWAPLVPGCTNSTACNFNPAANEDDGSCMFIGSACDDGNTQTLNDLYQEGCICIGDIAGCLDFSACNYDSLATIEGDVLCEYPGCTDITACFFDPNAGCSDTSLCQYPGCLVPEACNYNANFGCEDGSCLFPGCTDTLACNYDVFAACDDGSCVFPGCTDMLACNYDEMAGCEDGSCSGLSGCQDPTACNFDSAATCEGVCEISGCTDLAACNYEAVATCSDGSCTYPGCTDMAACNYNDTAACDDGSCLFPGCQDASACNYDAFAACGDISLCGYPAVGLNCDGSCVADTNSNLICDEFELPGGCTDPTACNFILEDTISLDDVCLYGGCADFSACNYEPSSSCDDGSCFYPGCTEPAACNFDEAAGCDDGSCLFPGCTEMTACNYNMMAGCDDGSCLFPGCTDMTACNYDGMASCDDGSCLFPGCTDMLACNYDEMAGCDDGSCLFPGCTEVNACNYDAGAACDNGSCTFPGCNDATACNYDMAAGCDDGSCTYTGTGTATLIMEHFDSYVAGDGVAAQSDLWDTWDGTAAPDAIVVDSVSFSPSNSALISGQATDLVLPIGPYNTGRVITDFKMKLTDAGGYFNFLHNWANNNTNYQWACDVFFGGDGVVTATLGGADFTGNDVPVGEWFDVKVIADMYMDSGWVYINNELLGNWQWSLNNTNGAAGNNQIAAIDFFGTNNASGEGVYYIDDVQVVYSTYLDCDGNCLNDADGDGICDELEVRVNEITAMGLPLVFPNPSNGVYQVVAD
ncbi:MAG: hypothetical protein ACKOW8_00105, partial [Flavobacteriales bacterium]